MKRILQRTLFVIVTLTLIMIWAGGTAMAHGPTGDAPSAEEQDVAPEEAAAVPADTVRGPTRLTLTLEQIEPNTARASAVVTDSTGQPMLGVKVAFSRRTTFGQLNVKTVLTNVNGVAAADLPVYPGQEVEVTAVFKGNKNLAPAETTAKLSVPASAPSPRKPGMLTQRPNPRFAAILGLVLGGVWATIVHVLLLLAKIKRVGAANPPL